MGTLLLAWAWRADRAWFELHALRLYCATTAHEIGEARAARVGAALAGLAILFVLRPRLARMAVRHSPRALAGFALRLVLAVVLALVVSDGLLRWRGRKGDPFPPRPDLPPLRTDPRYGWGLAPSRTTVIQVAGREVTYAVDRDGCRARSQDDVVDPSRPTLLFAGESIAFGIGLEQEETYPALVGRDLGVQAMNCSVHAQGSDQIYLHMGEVLAKLARPIAVVTLVASDQLARNTYEHRPRLGLGEGGALVPVAPAPLLLRSSPLRELLKALVPLHDAEAVQVAHAVFVATAREARERGAFPLFVLTNFGPYCLPDESGEPPLARALFGELRYVRVDLEASDKIPGDDHPNAKGARRIADAIEKALALAPVRP